MTDKERAYQPVASENKHSQPIRKRFLILADAQNDLFMDKKQHFHSLIERYALAVAATCIESASPKEQTRLIKLLHTIEPAPPAGQKRLPAGLVTTGGKNNESPFDELEQQWVEVLDKPVRRKKYMSSARRALLQRLGVLNQNQIMAMQSQIYCMESLIEQACNTIHSTQSQARLIGHYQSIHSSCTDSLAKLRVFEAKNLSLLAEV